MFATKNFLQKVLANQNKFNFAQQMRCVNLKQFGEVDQLEVIKTDVPTLKPGEVLMKVKGFGINRADIVQRRGKYPPPKGASQILGLEAFGSLVDGDPNTNYAALLSGGGYAEYVAVNKDHLIPYPRKLDESFGAGLAEVWLTAYQILYQVGQFGDNQNILIYAGASGVGTSAIQLINYLNKNNKIFFTTSSQSKINACEELGATKGYNYKEQSQEEIFLDIKQRTKGKGVHVVLDCVGASNAELSSKVVARDGKWVIYGMMGGTQIDNFSIATLLGKRATITGTTLRTRSDEYKRQLVQSFNEEVLPGFGNRKLKFVVDQNYSMKWNDFSADAVRNAHNYMESNLSIGKLQVQIQE